MGGGDSKPEQQHKLDDQQHKEVKSKDTPKNSPRNPNRISMQSNLQNQENDSLLSPIKQPYPISKFNNKEKPNQSFQSQQFHNVSSGDYLQSNENIEGETPQEQDYFQHWDPIFHTEGSMRTKVLVLNIHPTPQFKNLERQESNHEGVLSWNYQTLKTKLGKQLLLRIVYQQEGGYSLNFLINKNSVALEGDEDIWKLICPFRTQKDGIKIGGLFCERIYEQQGVEQNDENTDFDPQIFGKWSQKIPDPRTNMRGLLKKQRENIRLNSNEGIKYRETSKYFSSNNEWVFSVWIEQKQNKFKCWMIQSNNSKYKQMSTTIKGDIQNRQSMYIEEMRKKKKRIAKSKKNKTF